MSLSISLSSPSHFVEIIPMMMDLIEFRIENELKEAEIDEINYKANTFH